MARKALITWGGWEGHEPKQVAELFRGILEADGMEVEVTDRIECFDDAEALKPLDLIVPVWTMSKLSKEAVVNVSAAVMLGNITKLVLWRRGM